MKIMTLHPNPDKKGVSIDKSKYEQIRNSMTQILESDGPLPFMELAKRIEADLPQFDGSATWYAETVKLDLEARNIIMHNRKSKHALIKLVDS